MQKRAGLTGVPENSDEAKACREVLEKVRSIMENTFMPQACSVRGCRRSLRCAGPLFRFIGGTPGIVFPACMLRLEHTVPAEAFTILTGAPEGASPAERRP